MWKSINESTLSAVFAVKKEDLTAKTAKDAQGTQRTGKTPTKLGHTQPVIRCQTLCGIARDSVVQCPVC